MVDGEASVMAMAMISSKSPSRQGARMELLVPGLGYLVVAEQRNSFWKNVETPLGFQVQGLLIVRRRGRRGGRGSQTTPRRSQAWPAPRAGVVPSWPPLSRLLAPGVFR
jgi:hypothetical protein